MEKGSLKRGADGVTVQFIVTDTAKRIPVRIAASCRTCSRKAKGVVTQGKLGPTARSAHEVLAKHDENYMPPEAADALKQATKAQKTVKVTKSNAAPRRPMIPELGHFALILAL